MDANEIRQKGIQAPRYAFSGGCEPGTDLAVAENLGIIAGILLELAAQGAERNEMLKESNAFHRESIENYRSSVKAANELRETLDSLKSVKESVSLTGD